MKLTTKEREQVINEIDKFVLSDEWHDQSTNELVDRIEQILSAPSSTGTKEEIADDEQRESDLLYLIQSAPKTIYLVVGFDNIDLNPKIEFKELHDVSWCDDKISECDIPYTRSDIAAAQTEEVRKELQGVKSDIQTLRGALGYPVSGDTSFTLSDGTEPINGIAVAMNRDNEQLRSDLSTANQQIAEKGKEIASLERTISLKDQFLLDRE